MHTVSWLGRRFMFVERSKLREYRCTRFPLLMLTTMKYMAEGLWGDSTEYC